MPATCPICGERGGAPCAACASALRRAPLLPAPPRVDVLLALLAYEDGGRELVARLKYRNARSAVRWIAARQAEQVRRARVGVDAVTWIPTTAQRHLRAMMTPVSQNPKPPIHRRELLKNLR